MNALKGVTNPGSVQAGTSLPANLSLTQERFNTLLRQNPKLLGLIVRAYLVRYPEPMEKKLEKVASLIINSPSDPKASERKQNLVIRMPDEDRAAILDFLRQAGANELADKIYKEAVSPEMRRIYDELGGGDTNRNGILDSGDKAYRTEEDLNGNMRLDPSEIHAMAPKYFDNPMAVQRQIIKDYYNNIISQLFAGHEVTPHQLKEMEVLASRNREAVPYLADIKARIYMGAGRYTLALIEYREAETASGQNLKGRFDTYAKLLRYESQLSFLDNFAAVLPKLAQLKCFSEYQENRGINLLEYIFVDPGRVTGKSVNEIISYLEANLGNLPPEAKALKAQLIAFQKAAATAPKWVISIAGGRLDGPLSNKHLGEEIKIIAPKTENAYYSAHIKVGKYSYKVPIDLATDVGPYQKNPLLVRIKIPIWKILSVVPPGANFNLEIVGDSDKVVRSYSLSRSEEGFSSSRTPMVSSGEYEKSLLERAQAKGEVQIDAVVLSHKDHPPITFLAASPEKIRNMIRALSFHAKLFPELTREDREELGKIIKKGQEIPSRFKENPELKKALRRLVALSDLYFTEGGGAYTVFTRPKSGWSLVKVEEPAEKKGTDGFRTYVVSPRYVMHMERNISLKGKNVTVKMKMEYFSDTQSGYASLLESLGNEDVAAVMLQGHRWSRLEEHLRGLPQYSGRKTPVAYFANHCDSWEANLRYMLARYNNVHAPIATYDKVFPTAELNLAFANGLVSGLTGGKSFDGQMADKMYRQVNKSKGGVHGKSQRYAYNPTNDGDGDGLPDFIDPEPGKHNTTVYDEAKQELHITTESGKKITLRNYVM